MYPFAQPDRRYSSDLGIEDEMQRRFDAFRAQQMQAMQQGQLDGGYGRGNVQQGGLNAAPDASATANQQAMMNAQRNTFGVGQPQQMVPAMPAPVNPGMANVDTMRQAQMQAFAVTPVAQPQAQQPLQGYGTAMPPGAQANMDARAAAQQAAFAPSTAPPMVVPPSQPVPQLGNAYGQATAGMQANVNAREAAQRASFAPVTPPAANPNVQAMQAAQAQAQTPRAVAATPAAPVAPATPARDLSKPVQAQAAFDNQRKMQEAQTRAVAPKPVAAPKAPPSTPTRARVAPRNPMAMPAKAFATPATPKAPGVLMGRGGR